GSCRRRRCRRRGEGRPQERGGAAVAGLRLLRPVREFRGTGQSLPRSRERAGEESGARMNTFARTDRSVMGLWWWTVDRWTLAALILLMGLGALLVLAASPAVATHLHLDSFYLVRHHFALLVPSLFIMLGISLMTPRGVRRLAVVGLIIALALTALTL